MPEEPRYTYQKARATIEYDHADGGHMVLDMAVDRIIEIANGGDIEVSPELYAACVAWGEQPNFPLRWSVEGGPDAEGTMVNPGNGSPLERLDLMSSLNEISNPSDYTTRPWRTTSWTPTLKDMGIAFCSCLECGATLMYWYDANGTVDNVASIVHAQWHRKMANLGVH